MSEAQHTADERTFSDREFLDMAISCLEHAGKSTAILDCQCASCKGFLEQSTELLETIKRQRS